MGAPDSFVYAPCSTCFGRTVELYRQGRPDGAAQVFRWERFRGEAYTGNLASLCKSTGVEARPGQAVHWGSPKISELCTVSLPGRRCAGAACCVFMIAAGDRAPLLRLSRV